MKTDSDVCDKSSAVREIQCGRWRLARKIGQGAYGVVYFAVGPGGTHAAVKVCRRDAVGDERHARELKGAKLYRAIPNQEGLVRMRELIETEWGFYTVMDLADDEFGGSRDASSGYRPKTLARVIEGEKALPLTGRNAATSPQRRCSRILKAFAGRCLSHLWQGRASQKPRSHWRCLAP